MYTSKRLMSDILLMVLAFHFVSSQPSNRVFSNLKIINELKTKQLSQLSNLMKDALDEEILLYNLCLEIQQDKQDKFEILGPFYEFGIEGEDIT